MFFSLAETCPTVELQLTNIASFGGAGGASSCTWRELFFVRDGPPHVCETLKPSVSRFKDRGNRPARFIPAFSIYAVQPLSMQHLFCFAQRNQGLAAQWRSALSARWRPIMCFVAWNSSSENRPCRRHSIARASSAITLGLLLGAGPIERRPRRADLMLKPPLDVPRGGFPRRVARTGPKNHLLAESADARSCCALSPRPVPVLGGNERKFTTLGKFVGDVGDV